MRFKKGDKVWVLCDVPHPDGGASVDAGTECVIVHVHEWDSYLVDTCEEQWDPGTGCGDGSEGYRVSTFVAYEGMLTSIDHILSDLIKTRAKLEEYEEIPDNGLED